MPIIIDVTPPEVTNPNGPCATERSMVSGYIAAEAAVLNGQTVQWGTRSLTRANLAEIREGRKEWERKLGACLQCNQGGMRPRMGGLNVTLADISGNGDRKC